MLSKSIQYHLRAARRFASRLLLGPFSPDFGYQHHCPDSWIKDEYDLKGLRDFIQQERKFGLLQRHLLVGTSGNREVWLDSGMHFMVSGVAGTGKSVLEGLLAFQRVATGLPVLVLDWMGDTVSRDRIQEGLRQAGLQTLPELRISEVHEFNGLWQGCGMHDILKAVDEMRLVLQRLSHALSCLDKPFDAPRLILIPEADWFLHNPQSPEAEVLEHLLAQGRSMNIAIGLLVQQPYQDALAQCFTFVEFGRELPVGTCAVRTGSKLRLGVSYKDEYISTKVPFFSPNVA